MPLLPGEHVEVVTIIKGNQSVVSRQVSPFFHILTGSFSNAIFLEFTIVLDTFCSFLLICMGFSVWLFEYIVLLIVHFVLGLFSFTPFVLMVFHCSVFVTGLLAFTDSSVFTTVCSSVSRFQRFFRLLLFSLLRIASSLCYFQEFTEIDLLFPPVLWTAYSACVLRCQFVRAHLSDQ